MSVLIGTVANSIPTGYGHQRKIDRTSNGVLWVFHAAETSNAAAVIPYYSLDEGVTWTVAPAIQNGSGGGGQTYTKNHSVFIDIDDYAHVVFKDASDGYLYYRRGTPNAGRTDWTWSGIVSISTNAYSDLPDIVAIRRGDGTGWNVFIVWSYKPSALWTAYLRLNISTGQSITIDTTGEGIATTLSGGGYALGGSYSSPQSGSYPSIDFNHTGDGKTVAGGTPHLYVAWSSGGGGAGRGIRFNKATFAGTVWSWDGEVEIKSNYWVSSVGFWLTCMFDGTRVAIAGFLYNGGADPSWLVTERNATNTTTTEREAVTLPSASYLSCGTATYDSAGNYYLIGRSGENKLVTRKWNRSTLGFQGTVLVDTTIPSGSGWVSAKRGGSYGRNEFIYTDGDSSPYTVKYSYVGDPNPEAYPGVAATSTTNIPTAYSNQRKIDRCSNGNIWVAYNSGGSNSYAAALKYSTDNGVSWIDGGGIPNSANSFDSNATKHTSIFIDADDYLHTVFKDPLAGGIYYRRGTPNGARTSWSWSSAVNLSGTSGNFNYPDLVACRNAATSGWDVFVVASWFNGGAAYARIPISSSGVFGAVSTDGLATSFSDSLFGSLQYRMTALETYPSIDFHHTGDGKTVLGGSPHLYVAYSMGSANWGVRYRKAVYSGGAWTWNAERTIDANLYAQNQYRWLNCLYDGTRVIIGGQLTGPSSYDYYFLFERDETDTVTTSRFSTPMVGTVDQDYSLSTGSMTYDKQGNVYLFGVNTYESEGQRDLVSRRWNRSTQTLESEVVFDSTSSQLTVFASAKRGYSFNSIEFLYTDGTASPYSIMYDRIQLNRPPLAPSLVTVSGSSVNKTVSWQHNDPNGDPQSKYQLRWRKVI